jgi:mandelate racemase
MVASKLVALEALTIRGVTTRAVKAPLAITLGTSAATISEVPLLLVDLDTGEGIVGRSYLFCYTTSGARAIAAHLAEAVEFVRGRRAAPADLMTWLMRRFALLGVTGPVRMALSAFDLALWDALGKAAGQPVASLLGSAPRPIRAYDSRGLGLIGPDQLVREAEAMLRNGLKAIKLRLGYATLEEDLAAVRAVRGRLPAEITLMTDYNQALTTAEAIRRGLALQGEGIAWIEEPIRHDDYRGNAAIARALDVPLQIGENFNGPEGMADALALDACDYVMPDVGRIGGVTGWMQAAGIAAARGIEMSSHLLPEASLQLLAATPTAHWLEYVDWADAFLEEPLQLRNGCAIPTDRPGLGLAWDAARLKRLETL